MANNKNPNEKLPGEKAPGKHHYNPGNMSGKKVEPMECKLVGTVYRTNPHERRCSSIEDGSD
jgi:hypothetical protein